MTRPDALCVGLCLGRSSLCAARSVSIHDRCKAVYVGPIIG